MIRFLLSAILLLAACGGARPAPTEKQQEQRKPIQCGELTCGADERCVNKCECCGIPAPPEALRGSSYCEPLPQSCLDGSQPDTCQRTIAIPCA